MTKEFVLQLVENSASSIFSREDVIKLINSVEGGRSILVNDIQRAIEDVIDWMENNPRDVINEDSATFELEYNSRVMIKTIEVDTDNIREALERNFMDFGEADDLVELERSNDEEVDD